jgi:ABC-type sugar transport system substrate-binding protein
MRVLALVGLVALMVVGAGCQQEAEAPKPPEARTFALITMVESELVATGANLSKERGTTLQLSEARTVAEQVKLLNEIAAAKTVDGVAIDCIASAEVSAAVAKCVQAGIRVVTYNGDCLGAERTGLEGTTQKAGDPGRHCFVGTRLEEVGRILGHQAFTHLRDNAGGGGVVAVLSGPDSPNQALIEKGIKDYLEGMPDITLRDPVRPDVKPEAVTQAVRTVQQQESNVAAWIILNPAAVPDAAAAPLTGLGDQEVVMLSSHKAAFDVVGPEKVDVLVSLPFAEYGSAVVQILDGATRRLELYPNTVHFGPAVITIDKLEDAKKHRQRVLSGEAKAVVMPTGGFKPNQPSGDAPADEAPADEAPVDDAPADDATGAADDDATSTE